MAKPKNRVVSLDFPALASMSRRILSRMMKNGDNQRDKRRLMMFVERLGDSIANLEPYGVENVQNCD